MILSVLLLILCLAAPAAADSPCADGHTCETWETVSAPTDFTQGERKGRCSVCGREQTEKYYPAGTLEAELDNDPEDVKQLQLALNAEGIYKGSITGKYDKATANAVKKAEKDRDLAQDGICWPGLLKLLGLEDAESEGITQDVAAGRLQLTVEQTSPKKDVYAAGDQLTYAWTLANTAPKSPAKAVTVYHFSGQKSAKKTDETIDAPGRIERGESASGTWTYTVTEEDAAAGKFSHGFIVRGKLGESAVKSNQVVFVYTAGEGKKPPEHEKLTVSVKVVREAKTGFFFTEGETVRFRVEIQNRSNGPVSGIALTCGVPETVIYTVDELESRDSRVFDLICTVTAADLAAGEILHTAETTYRTGGETFTGKAAARVPVGEDTEGLFVFLNCESEPENGSFFQAGERVDFRIQVYNPSKKTTYTALGLYTAESDGRPYKTVSRMAPGTTAVFILRTNVSEEQAVAGWMTVQVRGEYSTEDGESLTVGSNVCTAACGTEVTDD